MKKRILKTMPYDMAFETETENVELCSATGYEVEFDDLPGDWWNEYVDSTGELHYGR